MYTKVIDMHGSVPTRRMFFKYVDGIKDQTPTPAASAKEPVMSTTSTKLDWSEINEAAFAAARGCYQEALLSGREAWSGAGLHGAARKYSARYASSRVGLLDRLAEALAPYGVKPSTKLLFDATSRRMTRRLVLTVAATGEVYDWTTERQLTTEDGRTVLPKKAA